MKDIEEIQPDIEARVLGQVICSKPALDDAADLEVLDFHMPLHRAVLAAIRELQVRDEEIDVLAILDEMELKAAEYGGVVRSCDYAATVLACSFTARYVTRQCFRADMWFLRKIAVSRREATRAA